MIAHLLIKLYEGEVLTEHEKEQVLRTTVMHNITINEAIALCVWSTDAEMVKEQMKYGNVDSYISKQLNLLANQMWDLIIDEKEIRTILQQIQELDYTNSSLKELYECGKKLATGKHKTSVLSAIRKLYLAVHINDIITLIYSAISKNANTKDLTVYRAINKAPNGDLITRTFMSAAKNEESSFAKYDGYNFIIEIQIPAKTPCIDITPFSAYDTAENEILFLPNAVHITERHTQNNRVYAKGFIQETENLW